MARTWADLGRDSQQPRGSYQPPPEPMEAGPAFTSLLHPLPPRSKPAKRHPEDNAGFGEQLGDMYPFHGLDPDHPGQALMQPRPEKRTEVVDYLGRYDTKRSVYGPPEQRTEMALQAYPDSRQSWSDLFDDHMFGQDEDAAREQIDQWRESQQKLRADAKRSVGEVARLFRTTPRNIKKWEREGWIPTTPYRSPGGQRRYTDAMMSGLEMIIGELNLLNTRRMNPHQIEDLTRRSHWLWDDLGLGESR